MARAIPEGFHSLTPYVTVKGAANTIEFLKKAFGAKLDHEAIKRPDGAIMHATLKVGDSMVMLAEESEKVKATPASLYLYVPNADTVYEAAIKAGGKPVMEPADQFYGDRTGGVMDPSGNSWFIATHKEDLSTQELTKRAEQFYKQQKNKAA
ncbi:MAG TPA: VOC family protein [Pseudolabrys sp.]|jgi:uncharacterized glyoxalase superfamily protein PhnB